jgi:plastocyanin
MKNAIATLTGCGTLALAGGCGSSASEATSSAAQSSPTSSTTPSAGLKVTTTPKYGSPPASAPVKSGVVQIAYRNITIAPDTVKVRVGSTLVWTNQDPIEHNVTSQSGPSKFQSGNFGKGKSFRVRVATPGTIHYLCTIHPVTMNGTIEVVS